MVDKQPTHTSDLSREDIQKRFNLITKQYLQIKGNMVGFILKRDGYIETGRNDQEVKQLMNMHENYKNLIIDIVKSYTNT